MFTKLLLKPELGHLIEAEAAALAEAEAEAELETLVEKPVELRVRPQVAQSYNDLINLVIEKGSLEERVEQERSKGCGLTFKESTYGYFIRIGGLASVTTWIGLTEYCGLTPKFDCLILSFVSLLVGMMGGAITAEIADEVGSFFKSGKKKFEAKKADKIKVYQGELKLVEENLAVYDPKAISRDYVLMQEDKHNFSLGNVVRDEKKGLVVQQKYWADEQTEVNKSKSVDACKIISVLDAGDSLTAEDILDFDQHTPVLCEGKDCISYGFIKNRTDQGFQLDLSFEGRLPGCSYTYQQLADENIKIRRLVPVLAARPEISTYRTKR